jgi:hypothetical protein
MESACSHEMKCIKDQIGQSRVLQIDALPEDHRREQSQVLTPHQHPSDRFFIGLADQRILVEFPFYFGGF